MFTLSFIPLVNLSIFLISEFLPLHSDLPWISFNPTAFPFPAIFISDILRVICTRWSDLLKVSCHNGMCIWETAWCSTKQFVYTILKQKLATFLFFVVGVIFQVDCCFLGYTKNVHTPVTCGGWILNDLTHKLAIFLPFLAIGTGMDLYLRANHSINALGVY